MSQDHTGTRASEKAIEPGQCSIFSMSIVHSFLCLTQIQVIGFCNATRVEFVVLLEDETLHSLQRQTGCRVSGFLFLNMHSLVMLTETLNFL